MKRALTLKLGGVRTQIAGLDDPVRESLRRRFGLFLEEGPFSGVADLVISVRPSPVTRFVARPGRIDLSPVENEVRGDRVHLRSEAFAGSFSLAGREGEVVLCESYREPAHRSVERFLRVALAWRLLVRGALLMHAYGIVDEQERAAHLVFSPEGLSGETLSRLTGGAATLGSGYVMLDRREGLLRAHGLPLTMDHVSYARSEPRLDRIVPLGMETVATGTFPVAGLYRWDAGSDSVTALPEREATAAILSCAPHVSTTTRGASRAIETIRVLTVQVRPQGLPGSVPGSLWQILERTAPGAPERVTA